MLANRSGQGGLPPCAAETIRVRPIDGRFAFVNLGAGGWSISGIGVQKTDDGYRISWPFVESGGTKWSVCTPPPGLRERLELEIIAAFEAAVTAAGRRR